MSPSASRYIDPRHGTHAPTAGNPVRWPGSVRRTTTVDAQRPAGLGSGLRLVGQGRDILTTDDGDVTVLATARSEVDITYGQGPVVQAVRTDPSVDGLDALVGRVASTGFRAVIEESVAAPRGSLLYLLLDEIPASTLVSGYAVGHASSRGDFKPPEMARLRPPGPALQIPDLCAGWQVGGVIQNEIEAHGRAPLVTGPEAPPLTGTDDPLAWHAFPPLQPDEMRRARRCDVWRDRSGELRVDAFFRDSHMAPDGSETAVHEYTLRATISADASTILACEATPRALPWLECPQAAGSAGRLAGMPLSGLRARVRAELVGRTTCTHLNDTLRELEDVVVIAEFVR